MSETFPSHQNETQAWQQELPLHRELDGRLKPNETLALIGSYTQSNLESLIQDNEGGYLSDYEFKMQQQTHAAALEQLATLVPGEGISVLDAILDRQKELEAALDSVGSDPKQHAEGLGLRVQLAGVNILNNMYKNVEDSVDNLAQTFGDFKRTNPRNRASAINEIIKQHNKEVSLSSETVSDSPEVREAQERINARFAEQAKQPQPTETVDDARQKVAEAFGDVSEKEQRVVLPEDERERSRFVKEYFAQHTDVKDANNEAVLKEFIRKETQFRVDEVKRLNRPELKAVDNGAMIFRIGAFNDSTLEELTPELRFTYKLLADKKPGLSYSEFNDMSVDEIALILGLDVRKDIDGYDRFVKKGQRHNMRFPNIDK